MMRNQKGMSIVETMVSVAILSFGLIGAVKMQVNMNVADQLARQRSEAVYLAESKIEEIRGATVASGTDTKTLTQASAAYTRTWTVDTTVVPTSVKVVVTWNDLRGKQTKVAAANGTATVDNRVELKTAI